MTEEIRIEVEMSDSSEELWVDPTNSVDKVDEVGNSLQSMEETEGQKREGESNERERESEGRTREDEVGGNGNSRPSRSGRTIVPPGSSIKNEIEKMMLDDARKLLENGPLEMGLAFVRHIRERTRGALLIEGVGSSLGETRRRLWQGWLRFLALFLVLEGEWAVATAWVYYTHEEENKEIIFALFNPGKSRERRLMTDVRGDGEGDGTIYIDVKRYGIPQQFVRNFGRNQREGVPLTRAPRDAEDILYGPRVVTRGNSPQSTSVTVTRRERGQASYSGVLSSRRVGEWRGSTSQGNSRGRVARESNFETRRGQWLRRQEEKRRQEEERVREQQEQKLRREEEANRKAEEIKTRQEERTRRERERFEKVKRDNEAAFAERDRSRQIEEIVQKLERIPKPSEENRKGANLEMEWEEELNKGNSHCPAPQYMGDLKLGKVLKIHQDFDSKTFPEAIVSKARKLVSDIMSTELRGRVRTKEEFLNVLRRLGLRVELAGKEASYAMTEELKEGVVWVTEEQLSSKEKTKRLRFYIKNRAGEFSRACRALLELIEEHMEDGPVMTETMESMAQEELMGVIKRLWLFWNLEKGI